MVALVAFLSVVIFLAAFSYLDLLAASRRALHTASHALAVVADRESDESEREATVRKSAVLLFRHFVSMSMRFAVVLVLGAMPIYIANSLQLASYRDVVVFLSRFDVLALSTTAIVLGYIARRRGWFQG